MNSITIAGQLGKDAEQRFLPNGDAIASFSVADSQGKDKPTIWWNCSLFGKRAEALGQYLTKGQAVTVSGNVSQREYTDKDGNKRTSMDVRVNDIALQGGKRDQQAAPEPQRKAPASNGGGFADMDSDIPF
jgi:single-strand DNA-binding protein